MSKTTWAITITLLIFVAGGVWAGMRSSTQKPTPAVSFATTTPAATSTSTAAKTEATSTQENPVAHDFCSATYGNPPAPAIWHTATSSVGAVVTLAQNNLYVNGTKIVSDIPASFGLQPARGVALISFFEDYATADSCDYYSPISLSPDGSKIAILYERWVTYDADGHYTLPASDLLIYSLQGKLLLKKTLRWPPGMPPVYASSNLPANASAADLAFISDDAAIINFSTGKGGPGFSALYRMDGTVVPLPYYGMGIISPDVSMMLYDAQDDASCQGVATGGMGSQDLSSLRLFNMAQVASTTVMCNPNIGFFPQSWSADGKQALAITVIPAPQLKVNGYLIYDAQTQQAQLNDSPGAVDTLKQLCNTTFKCPDLQPMLQ